MPEFVLDYGTPEAATRFARLDTFTQAYIEAAFFTDTGDPDDEEDGLESASVADLAPESLAQIVADCARFQALAGEAIADDPAHAGRDFWYTRNGHGCGFWDGDWPEALGDTLTAIAKRFGEVSLYRGDDSQIYLQ